MRKRVLFHRVCALIWVLLLIPAYLWWRDAIFFVIAASIYANVKSDWAASEAADDSAVLGAIEDLAERLERLEAASSSSCVMSAATPSAGSTSSRRRGRRPGTGTPPAPGPPL